MSLKGSKAGGVDNIVAELLKAHPETSSQKLHEIIKHIWEEEEISNQWLRGLIVKIPKKGDLKDCSNWRGITLLIVAIRILISIGTKLRPEQAGFREGRNTTEQIFILRNIIEQGREWQAPLIVNLTLRKHNSTYSIEIVFGTSLQCNYTASQQN